MKIFIEAGLDGFENAGSGLGFMVLGTVQIGIGIEALFGFGFGWVGLGDGSFLGIMRINYCEFNH